MPIVKTEAAHNKGVDELIERLDEHRAYILGEGTLQERRGRNLRNEVLAIATARMRRRLEEELREDAEFKRLLDEVVERRLDPGQRRYSFARATPGLITQVCVTQSCVTSTLPGVTWGSQESVHYRACWLAAAWL